MDGNEVAVLVALAVGLLDNPERVGGCTHTMSIIRVRAEVVKRILPSSGKYST
ncbi:MAG: hypothetical protein M3270_01850 [Thermoproteota archaeon]|nr:hypothetical protein [Thermoproteota archaeon]